MMRDRYDDQEAVLAELSDALERVRERSGLSQDELAQLRHLTDRIINGTASRAELSAIADHFGDAVAIIVRLAMSLRESPKVRELEWKNPYYSGSRQQIVYDELPEEERR